MAARFKKRPPGSDYNSKLKLEMLTLLDLMCPICQSIFIEPVTLPCSHNFCSSCFNGSIENNALACPLCRTRIGSWLRVTTKQNKLINTKLWDYIKDKYQNEINIKLNGGEVAIALGETPRILSAPGEIKQEYQSEVERLLREKKLQDKKHAEESEKLIKDLQEMEHKLAEETRARFHEDELLAKRLAEESPGDTVPNTPCQSNGKVHSSTNGSVPSATDKSKLFYDYLSVDCNENQSRKPNNPKTNTLDRYVVKKNGSANGHAGAKYIVSSPPSPELISTAGKCGRFLKNFLTSRLWGSSITHGPAGSSKSEPKVWEPQDTCIGHSKELSVNTGVVQHHRLATDSGNQAKMDDSISEEVIQSDTVSEDSLVQELCYFKPVRPETISWFPYKCKRCIPKKPVSPSRNVENSVTNSSLDMSALLDGLERLKGPLFWKSSVSRSSFVCMVQVPLQIIKARETSEFSDITIPTVMKPNKKTIKRKLSPAKTANGARCNSDTDHNGSPSKSTSPRKLARRHGVGKRNNRLSNESSCKETSPRKLVNNDQSHLSRSCVKLGSNNNSSHVLTRSKRSISFGDSTDNAKTKTNGLDCNNSTRALRSNGLIAKSICDIKLTNGNGKKAPSNGHIDGDSNCNNNYKDCGDHYSTNGDTEMNLNDFVFDRTLVEEQKRIEEMIAQEKKDFAFAKKLQRQLCGNDYVSTGYTVRTAAKKQATLRDILPVAKKMKV